MTYVKPLVVTVAAYQKLSPRQEATCIHKESKLIKHIMSDTPLNTVKIQIGATIPGVFGQYSSLNVSVGMDVPADTVGIDSQGKLNEFLTPYQNAVAEHVKEVLNDTCENLGREKPFTE